MTPYGAQFNFRPSPFAPGINSTERYRRSIYDYTHGFGDNKATKPDKKAKSDKKAKTDKKSKTDKKGKTDKKKSKK